jgi:hypothetical protein
MEIAMKSRAQSRYPACIPDPRMTFERIARIVIPLLFVMLLCARPAPAQCVVDDQSSCYWFWHTDAVFVGKVIDKSVIATRELFRDVRLKVRVIESFRGARADSIVTVLTSEPAVDLSDVCVITAGVGDEVFFYADEKAGELHLGSRSRKLEDGASDLNYARSVRRGRASSRIYGEVYFRDDRDEAVFNGESFRRFKGVRLRVSGEGFATQTRTNGKGEFAVKLPGAGKYMLEVFPPEGLAADFRRDKESFEIRDSGACFHREFQLVPNGRIRGRMVDPDGRPIPNLAIHTDTKDPLPVRTDADGAFDLGPLSKDGVYSIDVLTGGDSPALSVSAVEVVKGKTTDVQTILLTTKRKLTALTIDLSGLPEGAIEVYSESGEELVAAVTTRGTPELRLTVESGASFKVVVSVPDKEEDIQELATVVVKAEPEGTTVKLSQLLPPRQQQAAASAPPRTP